MRDHTHYVPILKGRQGEFTALGALTGPGAPNPHLQRLLPLFEVSPSRAYAPVEDETEEQWWARLRNDVLDDVQKFTDRVQLSWVGLPFIVDCGRLPAPADVSQAPILRALEQLSTVAATPAARPSESEALLTAVGAALGPRRAEVGLCLRLDADEMDPDESLPVVVDRALDAVGVSPQQTDVILDFGPLSDESYLSLATRLARLVMSDLPHLETWRSLSLGGGGFPSDLNTVPAGVLSEIPRLDARFWNAVSSLVRVRGAARQPSFMDYSIAHPAHAFGPSFAPAPQLRYTRGETWAVMRGRKQDPKGHGQFMDICKRVSQLPEFDPGLSWADEEIDSNAEKADRSDFSKPGNATTWRAIGTNHHLAFVLSRLATLGEP